MCSSAGEMSDEEIKKKTLASAVTCLEGKSAGEKAAIIHQHLGRREMTDVIIETMKASTGTPSGSLAVLLDCEPLAVFFFSLWLMDGPRKLTSGVFTNEHGLEVLIFLHSPPKWCGYVNTPVYPVCMLLGTDPGLRACKASTLPTEM